MEPEPLTRAVAGGSIVLRRADITTLNVDALINATAAVRLGLP